LNINQREARRGAFNPDSNFLFPVEWKGQTAMQSVTVFKNLLSSIIFGIDPIENLSITYLSRTKKLQVSIRINTAKVHKADLRVICTLKILAQT
jgi:hypothetical protein